MKSFKCLQRKKLKAVKIHKLKYFELISVACYLSLLETNKRYTVLSFKFLLIQSTLYFVLKLVSNVLRFIILNQLISLKKNLTFTFSVKNQNLTINSLLSSGNEEIVDHLSTSPDDMFAAAKSGNLKLLVS